MLDTALARLWIIFVACLFLGGCVCRDRALRRACPAPAAPGQTTPVPGEKRADPTPTEPDAAVREEQPPVPEAPVPEAPTEPKPEPTPDQAAAAARAAADTYRVAKADIDELKRFSRSRKALNDGLLQYLDAVLHWNTGGLRPPEGLDEAGRSGFAKNLARIRKETEKLLLRCLTLETVQNGRNIRTDVNISAARKLGQLGPYLEPRDRERLSKKIRSAVGKRMTKVKGYVVAQTLLEDTFVTLAQLSSLDSLEWMLKEYTHSKERELAFLFAAHKAMPLFERVPGKLRYEVVQEFIKTYAHLEARASKPGTSPRAAAMQRVWSAIRAGVIGVVRHYAGDPHASDGKPLTTLRDFKTWFRSNKSPRKEPWLGHR